MASETSSTDGLRRRKGGGGGDAAVAASSETFAAAVNPSSTANTDVNDDNNGYGGGYASATAAASSAVPSMDSMVPSQVLERTFRHAIKAAAAIYVVLTVACFALCRPEDYRPQESDGASLALGAASLVMGVSVVTRGLSLFFAEPFKGQKGGPSPQQTNGGGAGRRRSSSGGSSGGKAAAAAVTAAAAGGGGSEDDAPPDPKRAGNMTVVGSRISGAALVGFFVQAVSSVTNCIMALFPTPMLVDPVTGMDVYLLRWCEWAPLSFLMAYLTASMDADEPSGGLSTALKFALCQGVSTTAGLLFPFIRDNSLLWWAVMTVSVLLHATLYPLLSFKLRRARSLHLEREPCTAREMERHERIRVAAHLMRLITVAWAALVVLYFVAWLYRVKATTNAVMECSVEVLSKHLYLNFLLDAHHRIFDPSKRAERSLAEIGHMLSQVEDERRKSFEMDSSSDEEDSYYSDSDDDDVSFDDEDDATPNDGDKRAAAATTGRQKGKGGPKSIPGVVEMKESSGSQRRS